MKTALLVRQYMNTRIVGYDIASDEFGYPLDKHISSFEFARSHGIPCTAHAGEAKGPESVWETLEKLQPNRIGHGVRSAEDNSLLTFLQEKRIHLEVCPTSNVQTNVFTTISQHSINTLFNAGISLSINTDARTISNTTLKKEYELLENTFHWELSHFKNCNLEAIQHSFAPDEVKARIRALLEKGYSKADKT